MRLRPWFIASVGLNLLLVAAWYIAHIQEDHLPPVHMPAFDFSSPMTNTRTLVRYVNNFNWTQIQTTNLAGLITSLRAVGCPNATIRDIILASVNQSFARRRATEVTTPDQQWWKTEPDPAAARAASAKLRDLENARRALLNGLFGPTWETETDVAAWVESNYGLTGPHLGTLPPEIKRAIYDLAARAQDDMAGANPADAARAWQSERARLPVLLTPLALNEYLLRYSPTAAQLRAETRGVNFSPEQFQNLFAAIDPIALEPDFYYRGDDSNLLARQRALQARYDAALQQGLGSETYRALRLNQDPLYLSATASAQQAGVAAQSVAKLYEINRATQAELDRIRNDATLSSDDKIAALASTRTEQQKAIQQLIGAKAFERWLRTQSQP
jgi:hypothetical protein